MQKANLAEFQFRVKSKSRTLKYICTRPDCRAITDRKSRHQKDQPDHKGSCEAFSRVGQLPKFELPKHKLKKTRSTTARFGNCTGLPHITYNFVPILQAYKSYKLDQYEKRISRTKTPENNDGKLNRIAMEIEETKGLSDATGIQKFLSRA